MGIPRSGNFHFAVDLRALFNGDPNGHDIPADFAGAANFHASAPADRALHLSTDDDFAGVHIGRNLPMWPDGYAALGKMDGALHLPVNVQIFPALYFTF